MKRLAAIVAAATLLLSLRWTDRPVRLREACVASFQELGLPDSWGRLKHWELERNPGLSASIWDLQGRRLGMGRNTQARTRIFILRGSLRIRAGPRERILGPGAFVSIPRGTLRRVSSTDGDRPLLLRLLAPDMDREESWEYRLRGDAR